MALLKNARAQQWAQIRAEILERDQYRCVECGTPVRPADADVHHLIPRSGGGSDEPANLITLCDGCHAAHHPKLAGSLARRAIERWAVRLARWLDGRASVADGSEHFGSALRLFGLDRFREGQLPVVQAALRGQSILVVSPTGFGKTLCFQLPAVLRQGVTIVVSPLKALMSEQVSALLRRKIPASYINSDLSLDEKRLRYRFVRNKSLKLLYAAPERFFVRSQSEQQQLARLRPTFLVVDEAHCVDQWGRDFRPEYGQLGEIRLALGSPPVLAFTATAGKEMQQRILDSLGIPDAKVFVRGVDRPNIALLRWQATADQRATIIQELCRATEAIDGKVMIFVPTRKIGETLQRQLSEQAMETPFYHSRFATAWDREQLLKRFIGESQPVVNRIICTSAFGMGLDVPNVRMVIHWQHPSSVEDYLQEFGRAGRDGKASVAVLLHDRGSKNPDVNLQRFMAERAVEGTRRDDSVGTTVAHRFDQIDQMARMASLKGCFRRSLVDYFAGPQRVVRRSFAMWLLELVFADRQIAPVETDCCDDCSQDLVRKQGRLTFVKRVLKCPA